MTVEKLKEDKKVLEEKISQMLNDFISKYGVVVEDISLLSTTMRNNWEYETQGSVITIIKINI